MLRSCIVFGIRRVICRNSTTSTYSTCRWRLRWGSPRSNFDTIFELQKTRIHALSCGVVCVIRSLAVLVELRLMPGTDRHTDRRTHRQTQGHGIYRAEHTQLAHSEKYVTPNRPNFAAGLCTCSIPSREWGTCHLVGWGRWNTNSLVSSKFIFTQFFTAHSFMCVNLSKNDRSVFSGTSKLVSLAYFTN